MCVRVQAPSTNYFNYYYLSGPNNQASSYITDGINDVGMWNDYPCSGAQTQPIVCETKGEARHICSMRSAIMLQCMLTSPAAAAGEVKACNMPACKLPWQPRQAALPG